MIYRIYFLNWAKRTIHLFDEPIAKRRYKIMENSHLGVRNQGKYKDIEQTFALSASMIYNIKDRHSWRYDGQAINTIYT